MTSADEVLRRRVQEEFTRTASSFAARTEGRFEELDVPAFAGTEEGASVLEVGAGTGSFLKVFEPHASLLVALDLTEEMLRQAARAGRSLLPLQADGGRLPVRSRSFDLVASAQTLHHIHEPLAVLKEMRRASKLDGRVLIVDQVSTESYEQLAFMNQLEALRDPTHASSRPPSVLRMLVTAAGLEILAERDFEERATLSSWMSPEEFPEERHERVRAFIESFGPETGMDFEREGDDWSFTRRRVMVLAHRGLS